MSAFIGDIQAGKVIWSDPQAVREHVAGLEGKRVQITIKKHHPRRSDNQNAYYWGVIVPMMSEAIGYDREEMHAALKMRLLQTHTDGPLRTVRSTSTLNTKEFAEYVDNCIRLAAEMGIVVPDPRR